MIFYVIAICLMIIVVIYTTTAKNKTIKGLTEYLWYIAFIIFGIATAFNLVYYIELDNYYNQEETSLTYTTEEVYPLALPNGRVTNVTLSEIYDYTKIKFLTTGDNNAIESKELVCKTKNIKKVYSYDKSNRYSVTYLNKRYYRENHFALSIFCTEKVIKEVTTVTINSPKSNIEYK